MAHSGGLGTHTSHPDVVKLRPLIQMHSRLQDIPKDWLDYIEPRVVRGGFMPCWVVLKTPNRLGQIMIRDYKTGKETIIQRFVAKIFFDFDDKFWVYNLCQNRNCVNPNHIHIDKAGLKQHNLPSLA